MRGGAENNEASPRHLADLLPTKYNTPPSLLPPLPPIRIGHERVTTSCEVVALEMDLVDKELRGIRAAQTIFWCRVAWMQILPDFSHFLCDLRAAVHELEQDLQERALHPRSCHHHHQQVESPLPFGEVVIP